MRKGVADMERRGEVSQESNGRYMEALSSLDAVAAERDDASSPVFVVRHGRDRLLFTPSHGLRGFRTTTNSCPSHSVDSPHLHRKRNQAEVSHFRPGHTVYC